MTYQKPALTGLALLLATPAIAADITVTDAYARFMPGAKAGAAFMMIENHGSVDDRLVGVSATIAERTELHTHKAGTDGMMQMVHVTEGLPVSAGSSHALARGGDHVMFMGLTDRPEEGATIPVTLTFQEAGEVLVEVLVDSDR